MDAEVEDYLGAIGAAMSVQANQLAEHWTKTALQRWPKSPSLLEVAGKKAAVRGDYNKAQAYWKAALEATPQDGAKDSLFGILGHGKGGTAPVASRQKPGQASDAGWGTADQPQ